MMVQTLFFLATFTYSSWFLGHLIKKLTNALSAWHSPVFTSKTLWKFDLWWTTSNLIPSKKAWISGFYWVISTLIHWHSLHLKIKITANSIGKKTQTKKFMILTIMSIDVYVPFLQHRFLSRDKSAEHGPTFAALHRQWCVSKYLKLTRVGWNTPKFHIETSPLPVMNFSSKLTTFE